MENLPRLAGYLFLFFGLYFARVQVKRFINRKQGAKAWNFRVMLYCVVFIIIGVIIVIRTA